MFCPAKQVQPSVDMLTESAADVGVSKEEIDMQLDGGLQLEDFSLVLRDELLRLERQLGSQLSRQEALLQQLHDRLTHAPHSMQIGNSGQILLSNAQNLQDLIPAPFVGQGASLEAPDQTRTSKEPRTSKGEISAIKRIESSPIQTVLSRPIPDELSATRAPSFPNPRAPDDIGAQSWNLMAGSYINSERSGEWQSENLLSKKIKLGITSPDILLQQLRTQFHRIAKRKGVLTMPQIWAVVSNFCDDAEEFVCEQISDAVLSICQRCSTVELEFQDFVDLMTFDEIPADARTEVLAIRQAFDFEHEKHEKELREKAHSALSAGQAFYDIPVAAELIGASVIVANVIVIGVQSDHHTDHSAWKLAEYLFLGFFSVELLYHLWIQGLHKYFFGKEWRWNLFDFLLVISGVMDAIFVALTGANRGGGRGMLAKAFRLARLSRLLRVLRFSMFGELRMMVAGVLTGMRVLFWAVAQLIGFIYVFSVVVRQTIGEQDAATNNDKLSLVFSTIPWTMLTVFQCFTGSCAAPDGTPLYVSMYTSFGIGLMLFHTLVFVIVVFGMFNLIMATFVDQVRMTSEARKRADRAQNAEALKEKLIEVIIKLWRSDEAIRKKLTKQDSSMFRSRHFLSDIENKDKRWKTALADVVVTRERLDNWLCNAKMMNILDEMDIRADYSILFDVLDRDLSGDLAGSELVEGLMALRGPTEKVDVVASLLAIRYLTAKITSIEALITRPVQQCQT